jgi:hypothetical protein
MRRKKERQDGENCITKIIAICMLQQMSPGDQVEEDEMYGICRRHDGD